LFVNACENFIKDMFKMLYTASRKFFFLFDPETSHQMILVLLKVLYRLRLLKFMPKIKSPLTVMGIYFTNGVGLAAGFDKNGEYIDILAELGFGFIEVGTVTPRAQEGNLKPRIFRIEEAEAVINRLGFNNKGVDYLVEQVKKARYQGVLGINIGKNKDTPNERAVEDYVYCFRRVAPYASYITINISSPNTPALRQLQQRELLQNLLHTLKLEQQVFFQMKNKYVPLVVKIAPDLSTEELAQMAEIFLQEKMDGIIATNTTLERTAVENLSFAAEKGGLSGKPLMKRSTDIIKTLSQLIGNKIPIIGCGGIMSHEDAREKIAAGASLVQIYTGLIYRGPALIRKIASLLNRH
jgi:dihydroorotate dehydrogenase